MAASFEEFESLVQIVCNRTSSVQVRQNAEQRMSEIQNDDSSWHILLNFLTVTDDSLLFFIGQGLTGIAWRSFSKLDPQEQNIFTEAITQTLVERKDISTFARSKIEQVLAAICASSCSLNPVTSMVVDITQPGFDVGISALRTVFEEVLKDDPRIPPDHHKALLESSAEIALPLSSLVCNVCDMSPMLDSASSAPHVLQAALQLMRELVVKLPVGPHLSFQVLTCLFGVVERYQQKQQQGDRQFSSNNAVLAVEVLTEVMSKRYIPPSADGSATDAGVGILVELVAQAVGILQQLIAGGTAMDESATALPLLDFVLVFVESHMQRCVQTAEHNPDTLTVIEVFLEDFSGLTRACALPEHLLKIVAVWEGLLDVEVAKRVIMRNDACLQAGYYIFQSGIVQKNEALLEIIEDIEDDIDTDPFTDQKVKDVLDHILGRKKAENSISAQQRTDEGSSVGYALLQSLNRCVSMFAESSVFAENLGPVAQELLQETLEALSSGTGSPAVAIDCVFLLRLVPLFMGPQDIIPSLLPVVSGMLQARSYSRGKCFVYLLQSSCKFLEALLISFVFQEFAAGETCPPAGQQLLLEFMCAVVDIAGSSCDVMISPPPLVVMGSGIVLLLQTLGLAESNRLKDMKPAITEALGEGIKQLFDSTQGGMALPLEVGTLLFCAASHLYDNVVSTTCSRWMELVGRAKGLEEQGTEAWTVGSLGHLSRYNCFLDAMARYRSSSSPVVRQLLIEALGDVSENIDWVVSSLLQCAVRSTGHRSGQVAPSAAMHAAASSVALSQSMLQNLGKKHFFQQASSVLMLCHSLLCNQDFDLPDNIRMSLIFEGAGLEFTHQALSLTRIIASSSSSAGSTVSDQSEVTLQILQGVSVALNDKALCADLLEEVLRCGWTSVSCYWRGDNTKAGPLVSFLMDLFDACMDSSVPPHDALLAVEGPLSLHESNGLFQSEWFRTHCWDNAVTTCLRVLALGIHAAHHDTIASMLQKLLAAYSIAALAASGSTSGTDISFWPFVCGQLLAIATESGCGDRAEELMVEVTETIVQPMQQAGHDVDNVVEVLLARILRPVAALIRRQQR